MREFNEKSEQLEIISEKVNTYFKDKKKTARWMCSNNPLLGGFSPSYMIMIGRVKKLEKFIENAFEGNKNVE